MYGHEVARGVATLDAYDPRWRGVVDVDRLRLSDVVDCTVGQALGVTCPGRVPTTAVARGDALGWHDALDLLGAPTADDLDDEAVLRETWCVERGFEVPASRRPRDYAYLTDVWARYLLGDLTLPVVDEVTS